MTSISAVNQNNQQNYATSEKKESASIFNNPQATESNTTPQNTTVDAQGTIEQGNDKKITYDYIKQSIEDLAKELKKNLKNFNLTTDDIFYILSVFGYDVQRLCQLTKEEFCSLMDEKFTSLLDYIYADDNYVEERVARVIKLGDLNISIETVAKYLCEFDSNDMARIIKTKISKNKDLSIDDKLKEKILNMKSISELTESELSSCINFIMRIAAEENHLDGYDLLPMIILLGASDKELKDGQACDRLYNAIKQNSVLDGVIEKDVFNAMLSRLSDSSEDLSIFLSNKDNIASIFSMFENPTEIADFLIDAQRQINSGKCENKQELANQIGIYLTDMFHEFKRTDAKSAKIRTPDEENFLQTYEKMEKLYAVAAGHAFAIADEQIAAGLNEAATDDIKPIAYEAAHKVLLSGVVDNPIKEQEKMNRITDNVYSEILTDLGYELITPENLEALMEKAAEGTLLPDDSESATTSSGIGYEQSTEVNIDNAYATVYNLYSSIVGNAEDEPTYTVETKADNKKESQSTLFNKTNLSNYTGSELADFISNGMMKFSDAVKQYSNHLSESGKRFVVQSIKVMDEGRQVFALNSTSNTARWEIMKKAGLLDEDLNVDFDFNHEKLREKYQG